MTTAVDTETNPSPRNIPVVQRVFSRSCETWSQSSTEGQNQRPHNTVPSLILDNSSTGTSQSESQSASTSNLNPLFACPLSPQFEEETSLEDAESLTSTSLPSTSLQDPKLLLPPLSTTNDDNTMPEEKKVDDRLSHSYPILGSVRGVEHTWDSDAQFPIYEIQRIQRKTDKLRSQRADVAGTPNSSNASDVFRESGFEDTEGIFQPHDQRSNTNLSSNNGSQGQSARRISRKNTNFTSASRGSKDSLSDVLGSTYSTRPESSKKNYASISSNEHVARSQAATKAQKQLVKDFHRPREVDPDVSDPSTVDTSVEDCDEEICVLHDLCGEAVHTDDIAWRNALCLLAQNPMLASVADKAQLWTPLHICCLGMSPPPNFIIRALLYVYPKAARMTDDGGRLPLHLAAASSTDVETMQMLLDEYPAAVYKKDDHGFTPLHLFLLNINAELSLQKTRILLGCSLETTATERGKRRHVLQRRGDHLNLSAASVDQWLSEQKTRPTTNLNHNPMAHEKHFECYPSDVQVSLRKLAQWKYRQNGSTPDESIEVQMDHTTDEQTMETNPAAIALPNSTQLPIHILVQRAIVNGSTVVDNAMVADDVDAQKQTQITSEDDEDDEVESESESSNPGNPHSYSSQAVSVLRLVVAANSDALSVRDGNGMTPLLQVLQIRNNLPSLEVVDILLGKRAADLESLPAWTDDLPLHGMKGSFRYLHPAMLPSIETGQLPLHIAAEEMSSDFLLIKSIQESYTGAIYVQDARGRTPLHLALQSYRRIPADPRVVDALYSDRVAQIVDDYGKLPFDLLVEGANSIPSQKPRTAANGAGEASTVYQKLFTASILGAARPDTPSKLETFLPRLRNIPRWLRIEACSSAFVQDLILEDLASTWKCTLILVDGILLVSLITLFRLQMNEFVQQLESAELLSRWYTYAVYALSTIRLFAQFILASIALSIGEFQHLCACNVWYWIDIWAMLFCIVSSAFLYGAANDERLLGMGTATTVLLWLSLLGYLKNWFHGMAVFVGGLSKVRKWLLVSSNVSCSSNVSADFYCCLLAFNHNGSAIHSLRAVLLYASPARLLRCSSSFPCLHCPRFLSTRLCPGSRGIRC